MNGDLESLRGVRVPAGFTDRVLRRCGLIDAIGAPSAPSAAAGLAAVSDARRRRRGRSGHGMALPVGQSGPRWPGTRRSLVHASYLCGENRTMIISGKWGLLRMLEGDSVCQKRHTQLPPASKTNVTSMFTL